MSNSHYIKGDKFFLSSTHKQLDEVKNIKNKIKDSNSVNGATVVAAYHFLIKSIF